MENMKPTRDGKSVQKALDAEIRGATMDDFDRFAGNSTGFASIGAFGRRTFCHLRS